MDPQGTTTASAWQPSCGELTALENAGISTGGLQNCKEKEGECEKKKCKPCRLVDGTIVPVGTIGYRHDSPEKEQHGIEGDHLNLYRANQNPKNCKCFWQPIDTVEPPPQPGWIPIQHFAD